MPGSLDVREAYEPFFNNAVTSLVAVKTSKARLFGWNIYNPNGSAGWVQLFNASSTGAVSLGTTTPNASWWVPASGNFDEFLGGPHGIAFHTGLVIACTTTSTGLTTVSTGFQVNLYYV